MRGLRLAATAAIVVLAAECASPARAHTQYYPINLSCAAGYDMQKGAYDSSVSNIYITIEAAGWRVGYKLSNGEAVFRQNQYNMTQSPVDADNQIVWTGTLRKQPSLFMRGELHEDPQDKAHFFYEERLWNEKQALVLYTKASCVRVTDFTSMTPIVGGPYEAPRTAYQPPAPAYQPSTKVQPYRPSIVPEQDSVPIKVIYNSSWVDVSFGAAYSVPLPMLIDTGAGLVSLPMMVAQALIDAGEAHWSGRSAHFTMADGSTQEKQILIIHRLNIGSHALTNVEASIEPNDDATPLLSFSVLSQIGKFTIDTDAGTLTFG